MKKNCQLKMKTLKNNKCKMKMQIWNLKKIILKKFKNHKKMKK